MTVGQALRDAAARLQPVAGSGRLDATLLLEHVTGAERAAFVRASEQALPDAQATAFEALVARRASGLPIPYLTGTVGFYGLAFAVDDRVLIPRPESELLVEAALADVRGRRKTGGRIADVGTGSGAFAIVLAAELSGATLVASDVSPEALALARENAARNGVAERCTFVCGDLTAPLVGFGPFDLVVANLPYVPTDRIPASPDPVAFEPRLALDGGPDGLELYRRLLAQLPGLLAPDATVLLEAAPPTIAALSDAVLQAFPLAYLEIGEDYAGLERFVSFSAGGCAGCEGGPRPAGSQARRI